MADKVIGKIVVASGEVLIHRDGKTIVASVGTELLQGDMISTSSDGKAGIAMIDESRFSLGSKASMKLDELTFNDATKTGTMTTSVVKGAFMFVTGSIAKSPGDKVNMRVRTSTATIAVRGTEVVGDVQTNGAESKFTLLPNVDGHKSFAQIENAGGTITIDQPNQTVNVTGFFAPPSEPYQMSPSAVTQTFGQTLLTMNQLSQAMGLPTSVNQETYTPPTYVAATQIQNDTAAKSASLLESGNPSIDQLLTKIEASKTKSENLTIERANAQAIDQQQTVFNAVRQLSLSELIAIRSSVNSGYVFAETKVVTTIGGNIVTFYAPSFAALQLNIPPSAAADLATATEIRLTPTTGNVLTNDTDPDAFPNALSVLAYNSSNLDNTSGDVGSIVSGQFGSLSIASSGSYNYVIDTGKSQIYNSSITGVVDDVFNYTISDGSASATSTVSFTVDFTSLALRSTLTYSSTFISTSTDTVSASSGDILSASTVVSGTYDASVVVTNFNTNTSYSSSGTNIDAGNQITGTYGTLTLNPSGTYEYILDPTKTNGVSSGSFVTDDFTYTLSNGQTSNFTILVEGVGTAGIADLVTYTYKYGDTDSSTAGYQGDYYTGYVYVTAGTYDQYMTGVANANIINTVITENGTQGYYTIDSVTEDQIGVVGLTRVNTYYDTTMGSFVTPSMRGLAGLGSEKGSVAADGRTTGAGTWVYDYANYFFDADLDVVNPTNQIQYYTFTYSYGSGEFYTGYGYAASGYTANTTITSTTITGLVGSYYIENVFNIEDTATDNIKVGDVYVKSYYDANGALDDTIVNASGERGLGSERGNVFSKTTGAADAFDAFSQATISASTSTKELYYFHYEYVAASGSNDTYYGYGTATSGTYTVNQTLTRTNELGVTGRYTIDTIYSSDVGNVGEVFVTNYNDADNQGWNTIVEGAGTTGLGSEEGNVRNALTGKAADSFSNYYEADVITSDGTLQEFDFHFTYTTGGDVYYGYGTAAAGTYAVGNITSAQATAITGEAGTYTIDAIYGTNFGVAGDVYVTSYNDSDGAGWNTSVNASGTLGLGSEKGTISNYVGSKLDNFNPGDDATLSGSAALQTYYYHFTYTTGSDVYYGYGTAAAGTYAVGNITDAQATAIKGEAGTYTIDKVYDSYDGTAGEVNVYAYYDAGGLGWNNTVKASSKTGLGSEFGAIFDYNGDSDGFDVGNDATISTTISNSGTALQLYYYHFTYTTGDTYYGYGYKNYTTTAEDNSSPYTSGQTLSSSITNVSRSGTTATITAAAHGYTTGDRVTVDSSSNDALDGTYTITGVTTNTFTYTTASSGTINSTADTGTIKDPTLTGAQGTYTIDWVYDTTYGTAGEVNVYAYYDADTGGIGWNSSVSGFSKTGLGSESGTITNYAGETTGFTIDTEADFIATAITYVALTSNVATITTSTAHGYTTGDRVTVDSSSNDVLDGTYTITGAPTTTTFTYAKTNSNITSVADTGTVADPTLKLYYFHFTYTTGDTYYGYGYTDIAYTTATVVAPTGALGTYTIDWVYDTTYGTAGEVDVYAYYDADGIYWDNTVSGSGNTGLGSESGTITNYSNKTTGFTTASEADFVAADANATTALQLYYYHFTYTSGDTYYGYGYLSYTTTTSDSSSPYTTATVVAPTGAQGTYTIDWVYDTTYGTAGEVNVYAYYDADTGGIGWNNTVSGSGSTGLGSESGTITNYKEKTTGFTTDTEADFIATAITYVALTSNVATITTSTAHGYTTGDRVTVDSSSNDVLDGTYTITGAPTTTTFTYAKTNSNITSVADIGTVADPTLKLYYFHFTYTTGDTYYGYGYTDIAYTTATVVAPTGALGTYTIDWVYDTTYGTAGEVDVYAYYDADGIYWDNTVSGSGNTGLGSESGTITNYSNKTTGFTTASEADFVAADANATTALQLYYYHFTYTSGDTYYGYGYLSYTTTTSDSSSPYTTATVVAPTGAQGTYTIDWVYDTTYGTAGEVNVYAYYDADTGGIGWNNTVSGSGSTGLGSESGTITNYKEKTTGFTTDTEADFIATAITYVALTSNVATITTSTAHGYTTGDRVTVDSSSNDVLDGTYTITGAPTTTTFTYAKTNSNITSVADIGTVADPTLKLYYFHFTYTTGDTYYGYGYTDIAYTTATVVAPTGALGTYTIDWVYDTTYGTAGEVDVYAYYDADGIYWDNTVSGSGNTGLGSESGTITNYSNKTTGFTTASEADFVAADANATTALQLYYYHFTYTSGDTYYGYGYLSYTTTTSDSSSPYTTATVVAPTGAQGTYTIDWVYDTTYGTAGEVNVYAYYDADTGGIGWNNTVSGSGSTGLGSESGTITNYKEKTTGFTTDTEADFIATAITYVALTSNVATITTSTAHGYTTGDRVTVDSSSNDVLDGTYTITGAPTTTTFTYAKTNSNITSVADIGTVADPTLKLYYFHFTYTTGDTYYGYGYTDIAYTTATVVAPTGALGTYTIDWVYDTTYGTAGEVDVYAYYDADGIYWDNTVSGSGNTGLGSESGTITNYSNKTTGFTTASEADFVAADANATTALQLYYYHFTYTSGDTYYGYGYLSYTTTTSDSSSPYTTATVVAPTGAQGTYTIDWVYDTTYGTAGEVNVYAYYDADTGGIGWNNTVSGSGSTGLGSESGTITNYKEKTTGFTTDTEADFIATAITYVALTSNVATITTSTAHGYTTGDRVTVDSSSNDVLDGTYTITGAPTTTTFTYAKTNSNITSVADIGTVADPTLKLYYFHFTYTTGDTYYGYGYTDIAYTTATVVAPTGALGTYTIDWVYDTTYGTAGEVDVYAYYDADGIYWDNTVSGSGNTGLGSESGTITNYSNKTTGFTTASEADFVAADANATTALQLYYYHFTYTSGDTYYGYGYLSYTTTTSDSSSPYTTATVVAPTGAQGTYTIDWVYDTTYGTAGEVNVYAYYDADTGGIGWNNTVSGSGSTGLGSESGTITNYKEKTTGFTIDTEADFIATAITYVALTSNVATITTSTAHGYTTGDRVTVDSSSNDVLDGTYTITGAPTTTTFTYAKTNSNITSVADIGTVADPTLKLYYFHFTYTTGDTYYGYGYTDIAYTTATVVAPTGALGTYTIDWVYDTTYGTAGEVDVYAYYDADGIYWDNTVSGSGNTGLGSEHGNVTSSTGLTNSFTISTEADFTTTSATLQIYYFHFIYTSGDTYYGYGITLKSDTTYAVGNITTAQAAAINGEAGIYTIDYVYDTTSGTAGEVNVYAYYDADTDGIGWNNMASGSGSAGLGSESGSVTSYDGVNTSFTISTEADFSATNLLQYYQFHFTYTSGDTYYGYGYATADTYAVGNITDAQATAITGENGTYTIDYVYSSNQGTKDEVNVYAYYDADGVYWDNTGSGSGLTGLGSESGSITNLGGSTTTFTTTSEADFVTSATTLQYYQFHFTYNTTSPNSGDIYYGYGYAAANTYAVGNITNAQAAAITGENGTYTIDYVYASTWGTLNRLSVYQYYDADTGATGAGYNNDVHLEKTITHVARSGTTATITTSGSHEYAVGDYVYVEDTAYASLNGYFLITSVATTTFNFTSSSSGTISTTAVSSGTCNNWVAGISGLGSESGSVVNYNNESSGFTTATEADFTNTSVSTLQYYSFHFTYTSGGDVYYGYGYVNKADITGEAGYTTNQTINGSSGTYVIDYVQDGNSAWGSANEVFVYSYYDADGIGWSSGILAAGTSSGLGTEVGWVFDWSDTSMQGIFTSAGDADLSIASANSSSPAVGTSTSETFTQASSTPTVTGSTGLDTLIFSGLTDGTQNINLANVTGIEKIDLGSSTSTTYNLNINFDDVFNSDAKAMIVAGLASDDTIDLITSSPTSGRGTVTWVQADSYYYDYVTGNYYDNWAGIDSSAATQNVMLLLQQNITVTQVAA